MVGIPGLLLAIPVWRIHEPPRGGFKALSQKDPAGMKDYLVMLKNKSFILNTFAMASMTFALGGLAQWMPTFLYRMHQVDLAVANTLFGGIIVAAGIMGTLTGGWLGDILEKKKGTKGYLFISGFGFLMGAPITFFALTQTSLTAALAAMFVAAFLLFLNTGPLNTVILNVTNRNVHAMAFAVNIFLIHTLGDAFSPTLLGWFSDLWGLRIALMTTPMALLAAALFCWLCSRHVDSDEPLAEREA